MRRGSVWASSEGEGEVVKVLGNPMPEIDLGSISARFITPTSALASFNFRSSTNVGTSRSTTARRRNAAGTRCRFEVCAVVVAPLKGVAAVEVQSGDSPRPFRACHQSPCRRNWSGCNGPAKPRYATMTASRKWAADMRAVYGPCRAGVLGPAFTPCPYPHLRGQVGVSSGATSKTL